MYITPVQVQMNHPATLKNIERTKQLEHSIENSLGYNPFKPHMSFASPTTSQTDPLPTNGTADIDANLVMEVDECFAMLLSLSDDQQTAALTAIQTVHKMLSNLLLSIDNKSSSGEDNKFRSIRMSNKAFQSKVAFLPGAVELLIAAGFCREEKGGESFLVHLLDKEGVKRLSYTTGRTQEILTENNSIAS